MGGRESERVRRGQAAGESRWGGLKGRDGERARKENRGKD